MKKLLLILLLLFPVHGAWAKTISIICESEEGGRDRLFKINTSDKIVTNLNDALISDDLKVNQNNYIFSYNQEYLDYFNLEEYDVHYRLLSSKYILSRATGKAIQYVKTKTYKEHELSSGTHDFTYHYNCKKKTENKF